MTKQWPQDILPAAASEWEIVHEPNKNAAPREAPFPAHDSPVNMTQFKRARENVITWPGYAKTPLESYSDLAAACGIRELHVKDEGSRFGIGSFKSLGAPLAVCEILREIAAAAVGQPVPVEALLAGDLKKITKAVTVATASDGNHGVAVAWAAKTFGCRSIVYMHGGVSEGRAQMIRELGAVVMRVSGTYDDSVRQCAEDAQRSGWPLVQDVSWPGYEAVPRTIYQGYTVLCEEIIEQMGGCPPTHILVNTGVGGFASAMCGHLWERFGSARPRFITVEPTLADCVMRSGKAGSLQVVPGDLDTIQAGLGCGEVAHIAWNILKEGTDDFVAVPDEVVAPSMQVLANSSPPMVAGESAVAGLAVVLAAAVQPKLRDALGLNNTSRVVVIVCEGATDPEIYERCVGRSVKDVYSSKFFSSLSTEAFPNHVEDKPIPFSSAYQGQVENYKSKL